MTRRITLGTMIVFLLCRFQHLHGQGDFGGNSGDFEDVNSFDNQFEDFDNDADSTIGGLRLNEDIENAFNNVGDAFNDMGNDMGDAFNDLGDDMEDIFNNLGNDLTEAFNSINFSGLSEQGKKMFGDLLEKAKSFTEDQIDAINKALASGNLEELAKLGLSREQQTAVFSAIKEFSAEKDSGVMSVVVDSGVVVVMAGVLANMFVCQ